MMQPFDGIPQSLLDKLAHDPQRPRYHFMAQANWMNDPNGLIQWNGQYHMFYQYHPDAPIPGTKYWGHAVSPDLIHWEYLPMALSPTPGGPDKDGVYSGTAVDRDGVPTLVYTAVWPETQCFATGSDNLLTWTKFPGNPIVREHPVGLDLLGFRDPRVWRENDTWYMTIGSGIKDVGGTVLLYRSQDFEHWEYMHPILTGDRNRHEPVWEDEMWECPDFFELDGEHILIVSAHPNSRRVIYFIGQYANHRFTPRLVREFDYGFRQYYAPQTLLDNKGRRIIFGWLWEGRTREAQIAAGWSGVMSLPRILSIRPDGRLGMEPAPEVECLRGRHFGCNGIELTPASPNVLGDVRGDCLEIKAAFDLRVVNPAQRFGLILACSPDDEEQTRIVYDHAAQTLTVDRARSSLSADTERDPHGGVVELNDGETLTLHIFLDRSVIELFANGWAAISARIYPTRANSLGLSVFSEGGSVVLQSLDVWELQSIW